MLPWRNGRVLDRQEPAWRVVVAGTSIGHGNGSSSSCGTDRGRPRCVIKIVYKAACRTRRNEEALTPHVAQWRAEAHPPGASEVVYGLVKKSMSKMTATVERADAGIPCKGWKMRVWRLDARTVRAAMANVNVPPGIQVDATDIDEFMMVLGEPGGVIGVMHLADKMNPVDYLQLHATGVMTVLSSVDPVGLEHSNVVRTKGRGPRGSLIL